MSYHLFDVGNRFTFKGDRCEVTSVYKSGFRYTNLMTGQTTCYMDWWFYKTTNSFKGRNLYGKRKEVNSDTAT